LGVGAVVVVEFGAVGGRSYTVWAGEALGGGVWGVVTNVAAVPTNRVVEVYDTPPDPRSQRFYRVQTPAQP